MRGSATRADRRGTTGRRFASNLAGASTAGESADTITIAVDTMGGDFGPPVTVAAALAFLAKTPRARVILVGRENEVRQAVAANRTIASDRVIVQAASEVVEMHEPPADALRQKKDSSMRVAINLVKDGAAQACVSAGNTGALMAISRFVLKTLPGIDRPAIASQLPTRTGVTTALDLGANVNCTPAQLVQFAVMGSALAAAVDGIERPTVGLLNIGEEDIKGNDVVKQTGELLKASDLNYYGNVEGNDIYKGTVDVIVCDGFVGNVALKTSEGLALMLSDFLREEFTRNPLRKLAGGVRAAGNQGIQTASRPQALQRRDLDRPQGHRRQKSWLGGCVRVPAGPEKSVRRGGKRRARANRAPARGDAGSRASVRGRRGIDRRCIAASPGLAAICRRRS